MRKYINIILALALAVGFTACHEPEYVQPDENATRGIISIKAIFPDGQYAGMTLGTLNVTDPDMDVYAIPIPWYYPITSDDLTRQYMTNLRIQATLAPNYSIEPGLGRLDLEEENHFTLKGPDGFSKDIIITGDRRLPDMCELVTFNIKEVMVDGIINNDTKTILIPYKDDLSSVHVSGQVSPHATLSMIGDKKYSENTAYNLNSGQTVTVLAEDGESKGVYTVNQGDPDLIDSGLNVSSFAELFNLDPVSVLGLPEASENVSVSLAGIGSNIIVNTAAGRAPILVNRFDGSKAGEMKLGAAVADVIAGDESEHVLLANRAGTGDVMNIYRSDDPAQDPVLFYSFTNPLDASSGNAIGGKMKIIGNLDTEAVIVLTAEGIPNVTTANRALYIHVLGGAVDGEPQAVTFALSNTTGWGAAPTNTATVVPAGLNPAADGWYLHFYDSNTDPESPDDYVLHYFDRNGKDNFAAHFGTWAMDVNCLDSKQFNHSTFMAVLSVSHFPNWGTGPIFRLYEITDPSSPLMLAEGEPEWYQKGSYYSNASGDVCLCPSKDGFRIFLYYYDHMSQSLGAYVADCIKK